jgi:hypothetical protein
MSACRIDVAGASVDGLAAYWPPSPRHHDRGSAARLLLDKAAEPRSKFDLMANNHTLIPSRTACIAIHSPADVIWIAAFCIGKTLA